MDFKIFFVEEDLWYGQLLKHHLTFNPDYTIELYSAVKECLANLHHQ